MGIASLLASAAAGCTARVFVHPMDTIRSRLMVSTSRTDTLLSTFRQILRTDGLHGLYRGFGISIVMQAPAVATYLSTYDWSKVAVAKHLGLSTSAPVNHLASGLVAEVVSGVFWVPMEVIKQRAQVRTGALASASAATIARDLLASEGPRAFFKGYGLTLAVFGPYSMFYFMAYERLRSIAATISPHKSGAPGVPSTPAVAVAAATAAAIGGAITTPLDVVKTRWQTQGDRAIVATHTGVKTTYTSAFDAVRSIAREEGVRGFLRGTSARVLWIMPGKAITMATFEFLKARFHIADEPS